MSRRVPYEPMHVHRQVSFARMQEILAKHAPKEPKVENLSDELWLVEKIKAAGGKWNAFDGVTTREQRRQSVRASLKINELGAKKCGRRQGKELSFGQVFELIYGEAL